MSKLIEVQRHGRLVAHQRGLFTDASVQRTNLFPNATIPTGNQILLYAPKREMRTMNMGLGENSSRMVHSQALANGSGRQIVLIVHMHAGPLQIL